MKINLPWGVQKIIIDFIGTNYDCTRGCHAFTKKGKKCKTKPVSDFIFCRKHRKLIKDLSNGDSIKDIAIAYLLMVYKGPNRKKITSNGIISKKVQEVPKWVGGDNSCSPFCFYQKKLGRNKKTGYCACPWCIEQYFKFFPRYSDRIVRIRKMIHSNSYPYNSTIDLFNNNVVRINKTIQKKNKKKSVGFWRHKMIPKKKLLNQFGYLDYFDGTPTILCCEKSPLKSIINTSYTKCANNTKSGFKENGFDGIVETQYMKDTRDGWSANYHRLQNTCPLVVVSSYEIAKIRFSKKLLLNLVVFSGIGKGLVPEKEEVIRIELPDDIIRYICSFFYEKSIFKKSFLRKKRIQFWKLVDPKRNFWAKVNENGEYIRYDPLDALAGAGGRL